MLLSNKTISKHPTLNSDYIAFINYDYKNSIESFPDKQNNPLQFPEQLFIEVEKIIEFKEFNLDFTEIQQQPIKIKPTVTKEDYIKKVNALKQHIQQGDI